MLTEISQTLSSINNLSGIIDRLSRKDKRRRSSAPKKEKYCSLYMLHTFPSLGFTNLREHKLELTICKNSKYTIPIRQLDWVLFDCQLEKAKPIGFKVPELWELPANACLMHFDITEICSSQLARHSDSDRKLRRAVKSMSIRCTYADGFQQTMQLPDSLKLVSFLRFYKSRFFLWWNELLILNT